MVRLIYLLSIISISVISALTTSSKLMIDHDGGADDAMAIFLALNYERYFNGPQLLGLTTTHGNVDEPQVLVNTQRILRVAGRQDVKIYRGANFSLVFDPPKDHHFGMDGMGDTDYDGSDLPLAPPDEMHAVTALLHYSKLYEGRLIVVALGVLTNIALAIRMDPMFLGRLQHLYVAGGHIHGGLFSKPEFNALGDVEAYKVLADNSSPERVTAVPFSQVRTINITNSWRLNTLGNIPTRVMRTLNEYELISLARSYKLAWKIYGWGQLDPAVVAVALNNTLIENVKYMENSIILCGGERGMNTNREVDPVKSNIRLVHALAKESYMDFLFQVFSAEIKI